MAFSQRLQAARQIARTKYDGLVADALLSAPELELAGRTRAQEGRRHRGRAGQRIPGHAGGHRRRRWRSSSACPTSRISADRIKPVDLLRNLKAQYVEESQWLPLEDSKDGLVVMAIDPERVNASRIVDQIFPKAKHRLPGHHAPANSGRPPSSFSAPRGDDGGSVGDLLSGMDMRDESDGEAPGEVSEAVENELVKLLNKIIIDAYRQGVSDIHIEPLPGKGKTGIRFRKDGTLVPYIEIPASYRSAMVARVKIMCDLDISERRKPQDGKIKFKKYGPLDIELRVATIPSAGGVEDIVMRILAAGEPIPLDKLGVLPYNLERLRSDRSKSRTACSSSAARPARARPPRCTRC